MSRARRIKRRLERLERRRDRVQKRLDGVERWDEVRHKGMKEVVDLVSERFGPISDEELIAKVKEELDRRVDREGIWEAISDFGINLFVDIAVYRARNRKKVLQRRLARIDRRIARNRDRLKDLLGSTGPISFSDEGTQEVGSVFGASADLPNTDLGTRVARLEALVADLSSELDLDDDLEDLEDDDSDDADQSIG